MSTRLYTALKSTIPKLPKTLHVGVVEGQFAVTVSNKRFLIKDLKVLINGKWERIIVWGSDVGLEILVKSLRWFGDGTFKTAQPHFLRVYFIYGYYNAFFPVYMGTFKW